MIPPESYDDATVQTLMREANRYLGMPYTFGGTAPASLTVPVLYAGYFQTAAYITCQEPQHRAFMTSVLRYPHRKQRQEISYFLQKLIMQGEPSRMLVFIVETVRWCIVVIQSSIPQSIPLTGRAIFMVLED